MKSFYDERSPDNLTDQDRCEIIMAIVEAVIKITSKDNRDVNKDGGITKSEYQLMNSKECQRFPQRCVDYVLRTMDKRILSAAVDTPINISYIKQSTIIY